MFKIRVECVLDKHVASVFEAITDHANYKNFPGIDRSEMVEAGRKDRNGEGALRIIGAGPFELKERITGFERPLRMNYHIEETNPIPMRHDLGEITLEPSHGKTRVVWRSEGHMNVPVLGILLDRLVERQASRIFRAILNHIEANP